MPRPAAIEVATYEILKPAFLAWPDVVLLISAFWYPPFLLDVMRGRGMKVVLLHTESPYQDSEQLERAAHADISLVNDPVNITAYQALGPAAYMPHAYREKIHYPADPGAGKTWDLSFVGTGFPSRIEFFEAMALHLERRPGGAPLRQEAGQEVPEALESSSRREAGSIEASVPDSLAASRSSSSLPGRFARSGLNVCLAGPWLDLPPDSPLRDWTMFEHEACVTNDDTAEIYRQSRCGINFYRRESEQAHAGEGWACGPREIELAACGTWFARDPRGEGDELFPALPRFTGPAEASEHIRWALAHPRERDKAAAQAREAVADRTFGNNARRLLKLLDN
jgi:hypothetical protein